MNIIDEYPGFVFRFTDSSEYFHFLIFLFPIPRVFFSAAAHDCKLMKIFRCIDILKKILHIIRHPTIYCFHFLQKLRHFSSAGAEQALRSVSCTAPVDAEQRFRAPVSYKNGCIPAFSLPPGILLRPLYSPPHNSEAVLPLRVSDTAYPPH